MAIESPSIITASDINTALGGKANSSHTHTFDDITGTFNSNPFSNGRFTATVINTTTYVSNGNNIQLSDDLRNYEFFYLALKNGEMVLLYIFRNDYAYWVTTQFRVPGTSWDFRIGDSYKYIYTAGTYNISKVRVVGFK